MSICHIQTLPLSRNVATNPCIVVIFGISLSGYAFINFERTGASVRCEVMFEHERTFYSCSHLHSVCATGAGSGLATRATLARVSHFKVICNFNVFSSLITAVSASFLKLFYIFFRINFFPSFTHIINHFSYFICVIKMCHFFILVIRFFCCFSCPLSENFNIFPSGS